MKDHPEEWKVNHVTVIGILRKEMSHGAVEAVLCAKVTSKTFKSTLRPDQHQ